MRSLLFKGIFCAAAVILFSHAQIADAKDFVIAADSKAVAAVVENKAAESAQKYLIREAERCAVALKLVPPSYKGKKIVFNVKKAVPALQEDAYSITFPDDKTMMIHCSEVSARFAVNHILQKGFGIRYLFPTHPGNKTLKDLYSIDINKYPKKKIVSLKQKTFSDDSHTKLSRYSDWKIIPMARNWNMKYLQSRVHGMCSDVFPIVKYGPESTWPVEIMPVINGRKLKIPPTGRPVTRKILLKYGDNWQPCWSHPAATRIAIANILEILKKDPSKKVINMDVNDNGGYCQCATCRNIVKNSRNHNGMLDYSPIYWKWVNDVANAVSKKYPHVIFSAIAYREVIEPPAFKLNKNVLPRLCLELAAMGNNPVLYKKRMAVFDAWRQKASKLDLYDYIHGTGRFALPRIYFSFHAKVLKDLVKNYNLQAAYFESDGTSAFQGPYQQLLMRVLWNTDLDVEKFLKEWCEDAVGKKAAPYLRKYYQLWEDYWMGKDIQKTAWYGSANGVYMQLGEANTHLYALKKGDMKRFRACMEKVVALAQTPGEKKRAKTLMDSFIYSELAATVAFAEILPPDGKIRNAKEALVLLKAVPDSLKAAEKLRKHPLRTLRGVASMSERVISAGMGSLGKVIPFMKDKKVRAELIHLSNDRKVPAMLRGQFKIWLGTKAKNLIENGSFEKATPLPKPLWSSRLAGARSNKFASDGKYSFCTRNGYFRLHPPMKPGKTYLFLCDIYIPKGSNEGRFTYKLGPSMGMRPKSWTMENDLVLSGGAWNTFSNVVSYQGPVDSLYIQLWFRKFERGERVYIDNLRLYCLDDL